MSELVTVVIPTYKRPHMLKRAILSVMNQTYSNIEIIVVDDNGKGTDSQIASERVIREFGEKVRYIVHDVNCNGSAARNSGWKQATGKYITFLDDDDEIADDKLEKQVNCLENLDASWGACYTGYHMVRKGYTLKGLTDQEGEVYHQALARNMYVGSGSNLLLRKSVVDEVNGYDPDFRRNQDIEFMARVFEHYKLAAVKEDLLTIHMEVRDAEKPYDFYEGVSQKYLEKFHDRLDALTPKIRRKVRTVIALDRIRLAISMKEYKDACRIFREEKVSIYAVFRYALYLGKRLINKESYGFFY